MFNNNKNVLNYNLIGIHPQWNHLIKTFDKWSPHWTISFNIKPTGPLDKYWTNVLYMELNNFETSHGGARITVSFIRNSRRLKVESPINGTNRKFYLPTLHAEKWSTIQISQLLTNAGIYIYSIKLDGKIRHILRNRKPQTFSDVEVYCSKNRPALAELNKINFADIETTYFSSNYIPNLLWVTP